MACHSIRSSSWPWDGFARELRKDLPRQRENDFIGAQHGAAWNKGSLTLLYSIIATFLPPWEHDLISLRGSAKNSWRVLVDQHS